MGKVEISISEYDAIKEKLNNYKVRLNKIAEFEDQVKKDCEQKIERIEKLNNEKLKEAEEKASKAIEDSKKMVVKTKIRKKPFICVDVCAADSLKDVLREERIEHIWELTYDNDSAITAFIYKSCKISYSDEVVEKSYHGLDDIVKEINSDFKDKIENALAEKEIALNKNKELIKRNAELERNTIKLKHKIIKAKDILNKRFGLFQRLNVLYKLRELIND